MFRWLFPKEHEPPKKTLDLDERVTWRLLKPEPFPPVSALKAIHLLCHKFEHHQAIKDAFVKTFENIFFFIPREYKITKEELTAEYQRMTDDPSYMDKVPTVPLHDILTNCG